VRVRQLWVAAGLLACGEDGTVLRQVPPGGTSPDSPDAGMDSGATPASGSPAQGDAGAAPPSGLAGELLGYWLTDSYLGDCLDFEDYIHFLPGGIGEQIRFDQNACYYDERGTFITPASYVLDGHLLTWMAPGSLQRFNVGVGTQTDGKRLLGHHAYLRLGPSRWRSTSQDESYDAEGTLRRSTSTVDLVLDAPLPDSGARDVQAYVDVTLETFDRSQAVDQRTRVQRWQQDLTAHLGPVYGEQVLLLSWPSDVPVPSPLPPSLPFTHYDFDSALYQLRLVLPPDDPDLLLLAWSRWSEHDAPPLPGTPQPCNGYEDPPCP
jgi:hypothetical protein